MAIRKYGVAIGVKGFAPVAEGANVLATEAAAVDTAVAAAVVTAQAVSGLSAVTGATAAVAAIQTASEAKTALIGTSLGTAAVTLLVNDSGSPTKAQVLAAIQAILAHVQASNIYS